MSTGPPIQVSPKGPQSLHMGDPQLDHIGPIESTALVEVTCTKRPEKASPLGNVPVIRPPASNRSVT